MLVYDHVLRELNGAKISNSKIVVDGDALYLLLTVKKIVEVFEHRNKLVIDINEDNVACLLVDYEKGRATFFTISYNIRRLRENYRLQTLPYRKIIFNLEYKAYERGLNVVKVDAKKTSITCPSCGYMDKKNRNGDRFKCKKCGFEFNSHYVACLNLFSRPQ